MRGGLALLGLLLLFCAPALAQPRRIALVMGNSAYRHAPVLANPANDARDIAAALQRLGFTTDLVLDADRAAMETAVRRLGDQAAGAEAVVFFYAGHAVEVGGRNWLIPVSANIRAARDLPFETLDFDALLAQVEGRARVSLIVLDSCRENPFRAALGAGSRTVRAAGLAPVQTATGTLVAFATAPGTVALDGQGAHSPFTAGLLEHIGTPALEVRQMLGRVRRSVREATNGQQVPWETSALEGEFYLNPAAPTPAPAAPARVAAATGGGAPRGVLPALGQNYERHIALPSGTLPLPAGSWRLLGAADRSLGPPTNAAQSGAVLVQERDGKLVAILVLRVRRSLGERREGWPTYACSQRSVLSRRVFAHDGDRMDCLRVRLWAPVQSDQTMWTDYERLFEEARARPGWMPTAMLNAGTVLADAAGQAWIDVALDPVVFGFPRDDRTGEANAWHPSRQDAAHGACVAALTAWAESLRPALRRVLAGEEPQAIAAPSCRARR